MTVPVWLVLLLGLGTGSAVVLGFLLWSTRAQRPTRVPARNLGALDELLPSVVELTGSSLVEGNAVELLENGSEFFPALLRDVERAETSIHLEIYAWWRGEICRRLASALRDRAAAGVEVRLLVDSLGSWPMEAALVEAMVAAGCHVVRYHPVRFRTLGRLNKRDHRKLAIFDGRFAYVFGHGVAEEWEGDGDRPGSWRDVAARVRGPAVNRLQGVFAQNWMEESSELFAGFRYFPTLERAGDVPLHVVSSSPRGGVSSSSLLYRLMIAAARREILVQNPYFAPGPEVADMLVRAAERGLRVRLVLPGPITDSRVVRLAGRFLFDRLLSAGVEVHEYQTTLNHHKVMVVDDEWSYLGSANFDERSFDINAEVGIGIPHRGTTETLRGLVERDLETECKPLSLDRWRSRPRLARLLEGVAYLVHDQL